VRRLLQIVALLVVILTGSLPGLRLLAAEQPDACACGMPMGSCPMKQPVRSTGSTPCAPGAPAPLALVAAPGQLAALAPASERRQEPSPFPRISVRMARFLAAGPAVLARPGPVPLGSRAPSLAMLSVFRI